MDFTTDSNGIKTLTATPTGEAGLVLNGNFDTISSLVGVNATLETITTAGASTDQPVTLTGGINDGSGNILQWATNTLTLGNDNNSSIVVAQNGDNGGPISITADGSGGSLLFTGADGYTFDAAVVFQDITCNGTAQFNNGITLAVGQTMGVGLEIATIGSGNSGNSVVVGDSLSVGNNTTITVDDSLQSISLAALKIGFFGATAVAQPTGDVATALTNLGLVASPTINATKLVTTSAATSGTVSFGTAGSDETMYLSHSSTTTSLTIALPSGSNSTRVGQIERIVAKAAVTTLTLTGTVAAGAALTTLAANGTAAYQAIDTAGTFIRIQ